jgi:hypothetical protein
MFGLSTAQAVTACNTLSSLGSDVIHENRRARSPGLPDSQNFFAVCSRRASTSDSLLALILPERVCELSEKGNPRAA